METPSYPIGKYQYPESFSNTEIQQWIAEIEQFPMTFRTQIASMTEKEMDTPYRPGGWTGRQVIHHVADSHMQAVGRFKLALTEDYPTIKPYFEDRWADLPDYSLTPVEHSLVVLDALHAKWVMLLNAMKESDFSTKGYIHPEYGKSYSLGAVLALYAWHGRHHLAHLKLITK
jgi:hypothetical protein